ncbi:hypothetical protein AC578_3571 [Pseudocercospora eumusae]|uniref:Protein YIF1 n=1 Tax=Pseudocercospora eumusae TaxID=321146 RepID=A0A139HPT1_9PEZI|nr:hypothetical protein AC578_3571 [Pseudocercospora eumusae]
MQRPTYANSPPLHHPVPQHVSTVPQLRSPPPPQSAGSQQGGYGYGGQSPATNQGAQAGNFMHPAFGGFINDPTTQMAAQFGAGALNAGQQYVEQNLNRFVSVSTLKHYFNVSNRYVLAKLFIVLFPWRHRPWSRQQVRSNDGPNAIEFLPPREDTNSPDMYIPLMALVTYILLSTLIAGLNGKFEPALLGVTATNAVVIMGLELVTLWAGRYFLSINSESQNYDLIAYSGYKFVGVIVTIVVAAIVNHGTGTGGWVGWTMFAYTYMANAFFLLRSLKYVLLPSDNAPNNPGMQTIARAQRSRRTQFLFIYSYVIQFAFMFWLTSLNVSPKKAGK